MKEEITVAEMLSRLADENMKGLILSKPADSASGRLRTRIRPILLQGSLKFQAEEYIGQQVFHKNLDPAQLLSYVESALEKDFRQADLESLQGSGLVLVSKKGKRTVKINRKSAKTEAGKAEAGKSRTGKTETEKTKTEKTETEKTETEKTDGKGRISVPERIHRPDGNPKAAQVGLSEERLAALSHNKEKRYLLREGEAIPFLVDLGVMTREGKVVKARYDKFRQINRFLEFIEDILPKLPKGREITIIDFGCGKSYLTFAMYYYLHEKQGLPIRVIGLDLKTAVIDHCNECARRYGYDKLAFYHGDIASYEGVDHVDMVVTLHACDTATDYALAKAVRWGASVILSVPCCQHELNRQIKNELLSPALHYGIIRERMAALYTDAIRAQLLESRGYRTQLLEFIDMEHTPKNILIRAVYDGHPADNRKELQEMIDFLQVEPTLLRELEK